MPSTVLATARIFEDQDESSKPRKHHRRVPSVGDVLRGRRMRETNPQERQLDSATNTLGQSPLGERHINSPPPQKRIAAEDNKTRPTMHKKTGSSVSLKSFIKSKDKVSETGSVSSTEGRKESHKPTKAKSSTNLSGLLKKMSKKDLKAETSKIALNDENIPPTSSTIGGPTPIWAQFATQPLEGADGMLLYPDAQSRSIEDEINLYTPRDCSEFRPAEQRNFYDHHVPTVSQIPPQRPFLEHRSSRSSIFKENLDLEEVPTLSRPKSRDMSSSRPALSRPAEIGPATGSQLVNSSRISENDPKRSSRIFDAIGTLKLRSRKDQTMTPSNPSEQEQPLSPQELDLAFEKVLDSLNIPLNMRDNMRKLKPDVKVGLMKGGRIGSGSSNSSHPSELFEIKSNDRRDGDERPKTQDGDTKESKRSRSRSRPRSRILTLSKRDDGSPTKKEKEESSTRARSKSRPRSIDLTNSSRGSKFLATSTSLTTLTTPDSATTPGDFIHYLREVQKPELIEIGKLHKLRILLRNESVTWTDVFVTKGGMTELVDLLYRIVKVEWREEHEDTLLHETLLCLKALCTTSLALERLASIEYEFFPVLLAMLFDEERKGPSEFSTRGIITSLLFAHLSNAFNGNATELEKRAKTILGFLRDPTPEDDKQPLNFISQMHTSRPYRVWCKEVVNVTKEVFWIFLHHMNVIPIITSENQAESSNFARAHFPPPRPPHPAAPYVGGVEWEATQYLSSHLELVNGLIASLPTRQERNTLREEMRQSGWEKAMGGTMRTCKEKFYGGVHEGLKVWVGAAKTDGWAVEDVRSGPPREASSPRKSPTKKKVDEAPKIAFDVDVGQLPKMDDAWI